MWRFHADQIWSRLRWAIATEGGALALWYWLLRDKHGTTSRTVLGLAIGVLVVLALQARRNAQYLAAYRARLGAALASPGRPPFGLSDGRTAVVVPIVLAIADAVLLGLSTKIVF